MSQTLDQVHAELVSLLKKEPFFITDAIAPETELRNLKQWDSMKQLTLLVQVEETFKKEFAPEQIFKISTMRDLAEVITQ